MRFASFRYCMIISATALGAVAVYYFVKYAFLNVALNNNNLTPDLESSIRALWLAFACQGALIAVLYAIVANRPHAVSREVIVLLGLLHLVESVLQFGFSGSKLAASLLTVTALFVLAGALLWPKQVTATSPQLPL
jgi:hypothetical protein